MDRMQTRRLLWLALVLAAVALGTVVLPFSGRNLGPLSTVPLSFLDFQRLVVGALILLGLAPAAGVVLHRAGIGRRNLAWVAFGLFALSMTAYARWWYQPIVFLHGMPLPAMENIALWSAAVAVSYGVASLIAHLVRRGRPARLTTACGAYVAVVACAAVALLAPLAVVDSLPAPRPLGSGYRVAWEKPFALPWYELSEWVLEAGPETVSSPPAGCGRLYLVAGADAVRVDLETGEEDWRTPLGLQAGQAAAAGSRCTLYVLQDSLYVIFHNQRGQVFCLDKETGAVRWSTQSPLCLGEDAGSNVRFTAHHILLLPDIRESGPLFYYAVETGTGNVTVVNDILPKGHLVGLGHTSSPYAWVTGQGGALALHVIAYPPGFSPEMVWQQDWNWSDAGWLVGVSAETDRPAWRVQGVGGRDPGAPAGVAIDQRGWVGQTVPKAGAAPEYVYHSLPDGGLRWRVPSRDTYGSAWLLPDLVLVAEYGELISLRAIARDSGEEAWRREQPSGRLGFVRPVLVTDDLIALDWGDQVVVLDRHDGATVWERKMPEPRGPADRVSIGALYPGTDGPVLVLHEWRGGRRSGGAVTVSLNRGETVSLPGFEDTSGLLADGYVLWFTGGEAVRSWHPALSGRTPQVKLQGEATRVKVRYAGDTGTTSPATWGDGLAFRLEPEAPWGGLGLSPHTAAYEVEEDAVGRSFGGQLLVLARGGGATCWITALVRER